MRTAHRRIKRRVIIIAAFIICILPLFISGTYSSQNNAVTAGDSTLIQMGNMPALLDEDEFADATPESPSPISQSTELYPCDINESENNGLRQMIKTYDLDASESPDCISRDSFENGGWLYAFTDLTKKDSPVYVSKDDSVSISIDSDTKDIDEIISKLSPTLPYSSPDGYNGLLSLDISSITVDAADEAEADPDMEADKQTSTETDTDSPDTVSSYHTTAIYTGTLSKLLNEKIVYSAYFTGMVITPSPTPAAPLLDTPVEQNEHPMTRAVVVSTSIALICFLLYFILFRGNVKVYNLNESAYVQLGEARIGFTYPVINLTPFAGKAVTGSFVLILNRKAAKRLSYKPITINYGGRGLQHIVQNSDCEYYLEVNF